MQFRRNLILFAWIFLFLVLFYQVNEVDGKSLHRSIISYRGGRRRPPSNNNGLNQPPDYNDPYPSQYEDPYNQRSYETPPTSRKRGPSKRSRLDADEDENEEDDLVSIYTRNPQLKLLVALSTGVTSFLLTHLLLLIIFNKSNYYLLLLSSIICSSFTLFFHNNNFSHFTRSLGVFTILILQNISIHKFIPKLFRQLNAVLFLSSRKIFPPNANHSPWKYIPISEKEDLQFSMTNTLLTMIITGAIIGWSIVKPIPLFPSWLGAILGASSIGYLTTFNDCYGDLLRFIGYTVLSTLSELIIIADDVQLRSRTMIILNQLFFFLNNIDKRYHIINTVKRWISLFLIQFTSIIYSMRGEVMNQGNTNSNRESNGNGNGAKRRYGASDDRGNGRRRGNRYEEGYDGDDDGADDFYPPSEEDQYPPYRR